MDTVKAAGMDGIDGTYVDDECFGIHDYDDTDHDTHDDTEDHADVNDDGGCGNLNIIKSQGLRIKAQESRLKIQGSKLKDQGSRNKAQGTRLKAQGPRSRIKDLVWPSMNILEEL